MDETSDKKFKLRAKEEKIVSETVSANKNCKGHVVDTGRKIIRQSLFSGQKGVTNPV